MKNEPKVIFLNVDPDPFTLPDDFKDHFEVTWSKEKIGENDIKYFHADEVYKFLSEVNKAVRQYQFIREFEKFVSDK